MKVVRIVGFAVLVVVGVGIYVGLAPESTRGDVASALADAKLNELSADSSPQQQVVNGWAAKDLLAVVARKQPDNRVPALLLVGVVAVAWGFVTLPGSPTKERGAPSSAAGGVPDSDAGTPDQSGPGASTPAGWFPDPSGNGKLRWWSGSKWVDYTRDPD